MAKELRPVPVTVILKVQLETALGGVAPSLAVHLTWYCPMEKFPGVSSHTTVGIFPELSVAVGFIQLTAALGLSWSAVALISFGHELTSKDGEVESSKKKMVLLKTI